MEFWKISDSVYFWSLNWQNYHLAFLTYHRLVWVCWDNILANTIYCLWFRWTVVWSSTIITIFHYFTSCNKIVQLSLQIFGSTFTTFNLYPPFLKGFKQKQRKNGHFQYVPNRIWLWLATPVGSCLGILPSLYWWRLSAKYIYVVAPISGGQSTTEWSLSYPWNGLEKVRINRVSSTSPRIVLCMPPPTLM